jgi:ABC-type dipeptide/oligopeptide/nickel transport system permease subunit
MAVNVVLIIIAVIVGLVTLGGCIVFIVYMQHPEDKNQAWFAKFVVVSTSTLSCPLFAVRMQHSNAPASRPSSLMPNRPPPPIRCGTSEHRILRPHRHPLDGLPHRHRRHVLRRRPLLPLPLRDRRRRKATPPPTRLTHPSGGRRLCTAICWTCVVFFFFAVLTVVLWITIGFVELPVSVYFQNLTDPATVFTPSMYACAVNPLVCPFSSIVKLKTSLAIYILAMVSWFGWFLVVFFGGIGLIALPFDLINDWRTRPRPIDAVACAPPPLL